jgi:hypothetical protein
MLVHSGYVASVTMVKLHPQGVELLLEPEDAREPLLEQAICCVSFSVSPKFCAFIGYLVDVKHAKTGNCHIVVSVPKQLTATNLRQSFRIPVIRNSGLQTIIRTPGQRQFVVMARDIAESGIEVEFTTSDDPALNVGTLVDVELHLRDEVVEKTAEVRRISGSKCGLAFTCRQDEQGRRHDVRLNGFVLSLQQLWLRSRVK